MKKSATFVLMVTGVLAGAMLSKDALAQTAPPPAPPMTVPPPPGAAPVTAATAGTAAVCDVVEVFNNYQRAKDLTAKLNDRREEIKAENKKRAESIDAIKMVLEGLKVGSKEYEDRFNEMQKLTIDRQSWLQFQEQMILREHQRLTREMYEQVLQTIAAIARERGFKVVLQRDKESLETRDTAELIQKIAMRKVLFSDESVDLTETVLTRLNQSYRALPK